MMPGSIRPDASRVNSAPGRGLRALRGAVGTPLTWMEAEVGGWVGTPGDGKPVWILMLGYKALVILPALI